MDSKDTIWISLDPNRRSTETIWIKHDPFHTTTRTPHGVQWHPRLNKTPWVVVATGIIGVSSHPAPWPGIAWRGDLRQYESVYTEHSQTGTEAGQQAFPNRHGFFVWYLSVFPRTSNQKPCKKWTIKYARWDDENQPNQLNSLLQSSDISLIPSDPNDPKKIGVSHNRLVDSIRAGCITVASPLESYKELSNSALLGNDFAKLVNHAVINYKHLCQKYTRNRAEWMSNFSPEKNSEDWEITVNSLFSSKWINMDRIE